MHEYQRYCVDFIETHEEAAVLLDMVLGKTAIALTAIFDLVYDFFLVRKVLVVAPLRVARDQWIAEVGKWEHLSDLRVSVVVGSEQERKVALMRSADVYVINRENVAWLVEKSGAVPPGMYKPTFSIATAFCQQVTPGVVSTFFPIKRCEA